MLTRTALLLALAAAAACGDNRAAPAADGGAADSGTDAPAGATTALAVAGSGSGGVLASVAIASLAVTPGLAPAGAIGGDPVARHVGGELFVVNRGAGAGASVAIVDDATHALVEQLETGGGDPRDVAVVGGKLYVPLYAGTGVAVLTRGTQTVATIDLSHDDPDGHPQCMSALAEGNDVYVACQLLDDATSMPRGDGRIYVIDAASDAVRASFALTTANPISLIERVGDGTFAIATAAPGTGAGCIERIAPGTSPSAPGCIANNLLLGGYATRLQFQPLDDSTFMWMAVASPGATSAAPPLQQLFAYDFMSSSLWPPISTEGQTIGDLALCPDGTLILADLTPGAAGLRAYQLAAEVTTSPLPIGLPPTSPHGLVCY